MEWIWFRVMCMFIGCCCLIESTPGTMYLWSPKVHSNQTIQLTKQNPHHQILFQTSLISRIQLYKKNPCGDITLEKLRVKVASCKFFLMWPSLDFHSTKRLILGLGACKEALQEKFEVTFLSSFVCFAVTNGVIIRFVKNCKLSDRSKWGNMLLVLFRSPRWCKESDFGWEN